MKSYMRNLTDSLAQKMIRMAVLRAIEMVDEAAPKVVELKKVPRTSFPQLVEPMLPQLELFDEE